MAKLLTIFSLLVLIPASVWASEPVEIEADQVDKTQKTIEAMGNVVVKARDMDMTCDYLFYDIETGDIWATGECFLKDPQGEIKAQSIQYNRRRQDAHIVDGSIFLYAEPAIISGASISRYGNDLYIGNDLTYTPCLGKTPAWSIKAQRLEIPLEGYGRASRARVQVNDVPVAYVPYLLFPAKLKRQSGLLLPSLGSSSDTGLTYGQPIYLTLGRSADMTYTPTVFGRRGLLNAAEFRYCLDYQRQGLVYAEFLHDRMAGELLNAGDLSSARPENRWYVKASQTGGKLTWDVNLVSNRYYFRDIGPQYTSERQGTWIEQLQDRTEAQISRLQYTTTTGPLAWDLSSQWKQSLTQDDINNNLQELPRLTLRLPQHTVSHTPLVYRAQIDALRLYSPDDGVAELSLSPFEDSGILPRGTVKEAVKKQGLFELSLPYAMRPYLSIRPYLQEIYRDTRLIESQGFDFSTAAEHWEVRGITLNTALYSPRFHDDWYHQIVPGISWTTKTRYNGNYDSTENADIYPMLLADDAWVKTNAIELSLANYIRNNAGNPVLEATFKRPYNRLNDEWGLFEGTLRINPVPWLTLEHTHKFGRALDPDTGAPITAFASQEHHTVIHLRTSRGDELSLSEDYNRLDTQTMYGRTRINLVQGFGVLAEARYDFLKHRYEFVRQGISYNAQCWGITVKYDVEPAYGDDTDPENNRSRNTTLGLSVTLLGLGDMQTSHTITDN